MLRKRASPRRRGGAEIAEGLYVGHSGTCDIRNSNDRTNIFRAKLDARLRGHDGNGTDMMNSVLSFSASSASPRCIHCCFHAEKRGGFRFALPTLQSFFSVSSVLSVVI